MVPIPWDATPEQLAGYVKQTNGLLFPGGGTSVSHGKYRDTGATLFRLAQQANEGGDVYPVWGTCLGFEELMVLSVAPLDVLRKTQGTDPMLAPLALTAAAAQSRLLGGAGGAAARAALSGGNVTVHLHSWGVLSSTFGATSGLGKFWQVLGTNVDSAGAQFVSLAEARDYPFFACQFHPEKAAYEWEQGWCAGDAAAVAAAADAHSQAGIAAMAHMASAFVEVARQSRHQPNPEQLIDRFPSQDLLRTVDLIPPKIMQTFVFAF